MFNIGPLELMVILIVALLVVGPRRLPELGRSIGRGLREFRRAQEEVQRTLQLTLDETEPEESATAEPADERAAPSGLADASAPDGGEPRGPSAPEGNETAPFGPREVAATLGQGIAELRRVREELQRSFRVDLDDEPAPRSTGVTPSKPRGAGAGPGSGAGTDGGTG
ncbi:MAG TPA: twin-arginine translocase TatA/TatE family subunit [Actinomycetota bacterium]|nr:twin-arginine translocase TatA/TatE family subunit [Actinomycetota bacterium]